MEIVIDGVLMKGADNAVLVDANNLIREQVMGYSPRSLGDACGVHWKKLEEWLDNRTILMYDELKKVCYSLEIKFRYYG